MAVVRQFMKLEASQGILLLVCAVLAMILANSSLSDIYNHILYDVSAQIRLGDGPLEINKSIILWINDGLMTIFFFLVGLELKRELLDGLLSKPSQVILPIFGAIGGMVMPALIYYSLNSGNPEAVSGWAIPTATDIAFAIGIFSIVGKGLPSSLKVFLLALAIMDDLGAILIIGIFYSSGLSWTCLGLAAIFLAIMVTLNRCNVSKGSLYLFFGVALWFCVLKSGVHATISGVIIAFCIPLNTPGNRRSLLRQLEHDLHPMVAFLIMPIFALANAGVSLVGSSFSLVLEPTTLGVILGLFLGKQIGILAAVLFAVKTKIAKLPKNCNWIHMWGITILAGIGFTMSLFVSSLAFGGGHGGGHGEVVNSISSHLVEAKVGILIGTSISAIFGLFLLKFATKKYAIKEEFKEEAKEEIAVPEKA
ncbi:MAG: Na+/H+ antiporter NhaA [Proteobacteria bacterium]|nr:Na+/H+ antiporter NhaA [Pseudomonadota bacterium]